jgi:hypothetical protein
MPAYILTGIPAHMAIGTNKLSAACGMAVATLRYAAGKKIHFACAGYAIAAALVFSFLGARAALFVDDLALRILLLAILPPLAVFTLWKKRLLTEDRLDKFTPQALAWISLGLGAVVGLYDGFIGPGAGMFLTLGFSMMGLSAVKASGSARIVNLASGLAALASFWHSGHVLPSLGLPAAACAMAGSFAGAHLAVKYGIRFMRPIFVAVVILLFGTMLYNIVF